ncbi:hypothetical protein ACV1DN_09635 [Aeromonas allosaccharophila]
MKFHVIGLGMAVFFASSPVMSDVYICTVNGNKTYTDIPCSAEAGRSDNDLVMPTEPKVSEVATTGSSELGYQRRVLSPDVPEQLKASCLDKWRPQLKDPRSPYIVAAQLDEVKNLERPDIPLWQEVVMDVRAKNSFGGYIPDVFVCGVGDDGLADHKVTKLKIALHTLGVTLVNSDEYVE